MRPQPRIVNGKGRQDPSLECPEGVWPWDMVTQCEALARCQWWLWTSLVTRAPVGVPAGPGCHRAGCGLQAAGGGKNRLSMGQSRKVLPFALESVKMVGRVRWVGTRHFQSQDLSLVSPAG